MPFSKNRSAEPKAAEVDVEHLGPRLEVLARDDAASQQANSVQPVAHTATSMQTGLAIVLPRGWHRPSEGRMLERQIQAAIGQQLRAFYASSMNDPVPDKFLSLLDQLESKADES